MDRDDIGEWVNRWIARRFEAGARTTPDWRNEFLRSLFASPEERMRALDCELVRRRIFVSSFFDAFDKMAASDESKAAAHAAAREAERARIIALGASIRMVGGVATSLPA